MRFPLLSRGIAHLAFATLAAGAIGAPAKLHAHAGEHFSAGEPGDPTKPFRIVRISIHDGKGGMGYAPQSLEVHLGEQIKFGSSPYRVGNFSQFCSDVCSDGSRLTVSNDYPTHLAGAC